MFGMCEIRVVEAKRKIRSLPHGDYFCFLRDSKVKTVLHLITGGVCRIHTHRFLPETGVLGGRLCVVMNLILGHSPEVVQPAVSALMNTGRTFWGI